MEDGEIGMVKQFTYLGSVMSSDRDVTEGVKGRIAKVSRIFGCLRKPYFSNPILCIPTQEKSVQGNSAGSAIVWC